MLDQGGPTDQNRFSTILKICRQYVLGASDVEAPRQHQFYSIFIRILRRRAKY